MCDDFADQDNVVITVDASNVAGPNTNNVSVICRNNGDGWYEGAITSGGYWFIYKFTYDGGFEQLDTGGSLAINMQRATNHLVMRCQGPVVALYVNDAELGTITDDDFPTGGFGISVSTFDIGGAGVAFAGLTVAVP
jgi:hypothetical protein